MIGVITHNFPRSSNDRKDAGVFVHDFCEELVKKVPVTVFCPGKKDEVTRVGKIKVHWFAWLRAKKLGGFRFWNPFDYFYYALSFFRGFRALEKFKQENPQVKTTLAMWAFPAGLFSLWLRVRFGLPYVVWVLGSDIYVYARFPLVRQVIRAILKRAEIVFADSIDLKRKTERLSGKKCIFLPSASRLRPIKTRSINSDRDITLTFLGRLELVKGSDILIDSLLEIKDQIERYKVNIIGGGSLRKKLEEKVREGGISGNVTFYGNVSDEKKYSILSGSHWTVIPSRSDSIPLVFSESIKLGVPVIVSALADLKFLVQKYKLGLVFKPESVDELKKLILKLHSLSKEREFFHKNTFGVRSKFSLEGAVEQFLSFTRPLL